MAQVTGAVTPEAVGGHGQSHGRQAFLLDQPHQNLVRACLEQPSPMAAIDAMKQRYQRQGSGFEVGWDEQADVRAAMKGRRLDRDEMHPRRRVVRMRYFDGGEMDAHG